MGFESILIYINKVIFDSVLREIDVVAPLSKSVHFRSYIDIDLAFRLNNVDFRFGQLNEEVRTVP
jgi:hypothetical protein